MAIELDNAFRADVNRARYYYGDRSAQGTHAYIQLLSASGASIGAADSTLTNSGDYGYDKFLLTGIQVNLSEKLQVTEVFGDTEVAYYFGKQPVFMSVSGVLIDSLDNDWLTTWLQTYSDALRGTKLASSHSLAKLILPNMSVTGSIVSTSIAQDSVTDVSIPFSFQIFVTKLEPTPVNSSNIDLSRSILNFNKASSIIGQGTINAIKGGASLGLYQSLASSTNSTIDGWLQGVDSTLRGLTGASDGIGLLRGYASALNELRESLFSPIYGVLNSLTKVVKTLFGDVMAIFNALVSPIANILQDITNIANLATSLVTLTSGRISALGRSVLSLGGLGSYVEQAALATNKMAGKIASVPMTVSNSLSASMSSGAFIASGAAFINAGSKSSASLPVIKISGGSGTGSSPVYKPNRSSSALAASRMALLKAGGGYSPSKAAVLKF